MTTQELELIHRMSSMHKKLLSFVEKAGCFYCLKTFAVSDIKEYIDKGWTALCPLCEIDSVLPEMRIRIDGGDTINTLHEANLRRMYKYWFGDEEDNTHGEII